MDQAVGDFLIQIDAAAYVIDCLPNMGPGYVEAKCIPLVKQIRAAKPDTPIVLVEDRRNTNDWILPVRQAHHTANHAALKAAFQTLQQEGVKNLSYIPGDELYGDDAEVSPMARTPMIWVLCARLTSLSLCCEKQLDADAVPAVRL